ncbi:hypothetical protein PG985_007660 [Apiospora marii]|uniref:uncharacterized protein n=1 Tax=Apiospora marii TaxID=335849 RepID=UPI00312EA25E
MEYENYPVKWYHHFPLPNGPFAWTVLGWFDTDDYGPKAPSEPRLPTAYDRAAKRFLNTSSPDAPRLVFTALHTNVFCYPKPGSREILALEDATLVDFDYLRIDRFGRTYSRLTDQKAEDIFCDRLRHLGAKRWTSMERFQVVTEAIDGHEEYEMAVTVPEPARKVPPSRFERNWYSFCVQEGGKDVLVAEIPRRIPRLELLEHWETSIYHMEGHFEWREAERLPQSKRLALARNMKEKCHIMSGHIGARLLSLHEAMEMVSGEDVVKTAEERCGCNTNSPSKDTRVSEL